MKNIIILVITAVLLFAVSAAISLYLQGVGKGDAGKQKEKEKSDEKAKEKTRPGLEDTVPPITAPPPAGSSEQMTKLMSRLQEREQGLKKRDEEVRRQEQRLEILMEDIRSERASFDTLRKQFNEEMKRLNEAQDTISKKSRGLEEQKEEAARLLEEMRKRQIEYEKGEKPNIAKMATITDSMEPTKAAAIIKQLADNGQMDTAVKLLSQMKERRAAQVLGEMTDMALAAQLVEKLRGVKKDPPPK